jgi:hypothetical protein
MVVFVLLGLVTGSATQAQELLVNPGFESGTSPWYIGDANQCTVSTEDPHSGTNSAKFVGNDTWLLMSQLIDPAQEGVMYDVSGWMKTISVTTQGEIWLQFLDSGWGIISESLVGSATGSTAYTQYSDSLLSPTGTAILRIRLMMPNGTGTVYFDDLSIAPQEAPGQASSPSPADSATDVSIDADLSWTAGSGATSHDVYFGTSSPGAFQGNQTATTFEPGTMANDTTYYWRIDEINVSGTTTGVVWSFTTTAAAPAGDVEIIGSWVSGTTHAEEAGTNRVLIFTGHTEDNNADMNITSVTYGGQSMTKVVEQNVGTGYRAYVVAYVLDEAGIDAASGSDFVVTWAETPSRSPGFSSVFLQNVNQSTPAGATDGNGTTSSATIATSALSTSDGDMVFVAGTCGNSGTYSVNNGFTEGIEITISSADAVAGYKAATGADETPSITHSNVNRQVVIGFVVQVGAAGPQPPGQASNPSPANSATGVSVNADLSWTAGTGSTSSDVYFGTSSPGAFQGNQTAATFEPGVLANNTTYYWRIDEINADGTTTGTVWNFTTIVGAPGQASSPSPADSATDVSITADLSWSAGSGATSHDVYFGTSSPGAFQGNQTATTFDTGTMANSTTYYWRIDEINAGGTTTGTVWNFTTVVAAPSAASSPSPADSATDVSITADLSWTAGSGATSHDVYFGTSSPGTFQGNQAATTFEPGVLANNTTYYWRIDEINAGGTTTGTVWNFTTEAAAPPLPGQASTPSPTAGATNVNINADLSWSAGSNATSHDVYFGISSPGSFQGNQAGTIFDPGTMANDTTYYWRIDEVNITGTTTGTVWSFTTIVAAPGAASGPSPSDSATDVSIDADLSWTAGSGATSHDVYFGISSPGSFQGNQAATTFDPGTMANDTTYYWRIDAVNAGGTTTGNVWSFTTIVTAPGAASGPSPSDSATDVSIDADLSWTAGSGATSHDVYFGTSSPGAFQGNQAATTFDPGTMANDTTYYWRIDAVNAGGTTTGNVWSFTTIVGAPGAASSPSPADSATSVSIGADLGWAAGSGATSHDVYFGTSSPGAFQGNQPAVTFEPGTMARTTYQPGIRKRHNPLVGH